MPRGGRRVGAGRKPKTPAERELSGRVLQHPSAGAVPPSTNYPPAPVEEFDAPDSLSAEARKVWMQQAPYAFKHRTLTRATALSFERYCKMVVQEGIEALSSAANGPDHRGLRKEINELEKQFMLTALGKPIYQVDAAPAANPLSKYLKQG